MPPYSVKMVGHFKDRFEWLGRKALARGLREPVEKAMRSILTRMAGDPRNWGDPKFASRTQGGTVYTGYFLPVIVHYVVFEELKLVWLYDIRPWPGAGLD